MNGAAARIVPFALATAVVLAIALVAGRALSRAMMFPASQERLPERLPGGDGLSIVDYRTEDGVTLRGVHARAGQAGVPRVVFFHGNGEANVHNLELARSLARAGVDVFLAEYRGYGGCAGHPGEAGLRRDAAAALQALPENGSGSVPSGPVVLVGRSLGTGVAVELAARGEGAFVILLSPYTSMVEMGRIVAGPLAWLLVADRFDSLSKAPRVKQPVVVLHGTRDEVIPFEQGRRLAAAFPDARFVPLEGRGHNDVFGQAELVAGLIREWSAKRAAAVSTAAVSR